MARALVVALAVLVASAVIAVRADLYGWELSLTEWAIDLPDGITSVLRVVMQAGNRLAVAAVALVYVIFDRPRRATVALVGGWGAWLLAAILKELIGRPRPLADVIGFSPEEFVSGNGYPSSHMAVAVALAVVVITTAGVPRSVSVLSVLVAAATGLARVHLAVHWPLDIVGGAAVGVLVAGVVVVLIAPAPVPSAWPGVGRWPPASTPDEPLGFVDEPEPDAPLRIATFNIRNGRTYDGRHSWPLRRPATAAAIDALDADLIGLQEVYAFQRRWLERRLPGRDWIGAGRTNGLGRGEQCPITWRAARLDLEEWGVRWFSDRPDEPGSRFDGAEFPRISTLARFRDRRSGRRFAVANAHLDSHRRVDRIRSAEMLVGWMAAYDVPWLVLGDLNDRPDSETLAVLEDAGYRSVGPTDDRGTSHQFTGCADGPRIDHVLIGEHWTAAPPDIPLVTSGRLPSDHWPLVVEVRLGGTG